MAAAPSRTTTGAARRADHAVAGHAVCDRGVMIDLSLMKAISVDPAARVARASGGGLWSELDSATQQHALATTGGQISHTGIAGLTLGGGLGHLMRKHGLTVDSLRAVDLVTADGERMCVDADSKPELFWRLRGGGGNVGIATSFEFDLHPVGPIVLGGPDVEIADGEQRPANLHRQPQDRTRRQLAKIEVASGRIDRSHRRCPDGHRSADEVTKAARCRTAR